MQNDGGGHVRSTLALVFRVPQIELHTDMHRLCLSSASACIAVYPMEQILEIFQDPSEVLALLQS